MSNDYLDYVIALCLVPPYVTLGIIFQFPVELWVLSLGVMMFVTWFLVWTQPLAKFIEIHKSKDVS